ncbi:LysE family translocator [Desulfovibrio ferrophilus]|uniref:Lysine exporter protein LYSE/YGGA n=1 Tax=Desulfovibrio ferrophilus TaxID=241368 RepID=A0A2Z6B3E9_9BACT|nr:LysE family translocator [Desulfovibrio ferrophilus]BBD09940.1 lysine exporter protein LYSE/YGGA [Desulfovibrio ferrophilus]
MALDQMLLFCAASLVLIFTPGPDIIYVMTRGAAQGRGAALAAAAGFSLGNVVHTAAAIAGVSALIASSAWAFSAVKFAGAAYLAYLGLRLFMSKAGPLGGGTDSAKQTVAVFRQSILANMLNPKVAIFFLAFFPQFVREGGLHPSMQMAVLGTTFIALTMICFSLVGLTAGSLSDWLHARLAVGGRINKIAGGVLVGLGLSLAWSERT